MKWSTRMNQNTDNTISTASPSGSYSNNCSNRLPCGICRLTMTICPMWNGQWRYNGTIWDPTKVTCTPTAHNNADFTKGSTD